MAPPVFGVVGWKNSGKTTLMVGLIAELARRGFAVSVFKNAPASFGIDPEGGDPFRWARARRGAGEVSCGYPRLCRPVRSGTGRGLQAREFSQDQNSPRRRCLARAVAGIVPW